MAFVEDKESDAPRLVDAIANVIRVTDEDIDAWPDKPSELEYLAIRIVVMATMFPIHWNSTNDILATRMAALMLQDVVAHPDGVYVYRQGAYRFTEEIPEWLLQKIEGILPVARIMLKCLMRSNVVRSPGAVLAYLGRHIGTFENALPLTSADLSVKKDTPVAAWALDACKGLHEVAARFNGQAQSAKLVDLLGTWTNVPRTVPPFVSVAFDDCAWKIDDTKLGEARVSQVKKSNKNKCYFGIPVSIVIDPPDHVIEDLRLVLATSFAGAPEGRELDIAMEAIAWMNRPAPPVMILFTGVGGNSKSARALFVNVRCARLFK